MAVYNGMPYLRYQLLSIINQLDYFDELIISDDNSTDMSIQVIRELTANLTCELKIIRGPCQNSPLLNFNKCLHHATKDIIVISDNCVKYVSIL